MAGPERTCVHTRVAMPAEALLRVVADPDGKVVVDYQGKLPGRGAWLTPTADVLAAVEKRPGALLRALELPEGRVEGLLDQARASNLRAVLDLLSLSARAGCLKSGGDAVADVVADPRLLGFVLAEDASPRSVDAAVGGRPEVERWVLPLDRVALGHRIGKGPRAVVAVLTGGPSKALVRELRRMTSLR